jgi:hypothetical protein
VLKVGLESSEYKVGEYSNELEVVGKSMGDKGGMYDPASTW